MSSVTSSEQGLVVALASDVPSTAGPLASPRLAQGLISLRGEREFRKVRQRGAVVRTPLFTLRVTPYRPRYGEVWYPCAIVGIIVPKKTLKHAVKRNRVRRRLREALRTLPRLLACRATLHPTPALLSVPFAELQAELERALKRGLTTSSKSTSNKGGSNKAKKPKQASAQQLTSSRDTQDRG